MESIAHISLPIYAVLMAVGGIMGFVKGKSKASLIAGLLSALLLTGAYFYSQTDMKNGLLMGVGVTSILSMVFVMRIAKTKKAMPAGALLLISIIEEMLLLVGAFFKL